LMYISVNGFRKLLLKL